MRRTSDPSGNQSRVIDQSIVENDRLQNLSCVIDNWLLKLSESLSYNWPIDCWNCHIAECIIHNSPINCCNCRDLSCIVDQSIVETVRLWNLACIILYISLLLESVRKVCVSLKQCLCMELTSDPSAHGIAESNRYQIDRYQLIIEVCQMTLMCTCLLYINSKVRDFYKTGLKSLRFLPVALSGASPSRHISNVWFNCSRVRNKTHDD